MKKKVNTISLTKTDARNALWRRGILEWKLRPEQRSIYKLLRDAKGLKYVLYCSRRFGKSFICRLMAWEDTIRHKNWQIGFVAPTQKQLKRIFGPIDKEIFRDCPEDMRPKYERESGAWLMPATGTVIYESGTDDKRYEDMVGMNAHKCYYDEPGNMTDLNQIVYDIIQPMTLTTRKERGDECAQIFLGTPPRTPAHPYYFLKEKCKSEGNYAEKIIYDNSSLDADTIELYKEESGGEYSTSWKREYLCQDVVDSEKAILPEFDAEAKKELIRVHEEPEYFELYGAFDPGHLNDFYAYLLGYYDFLNGVYVVRCELFLDNVSTSVVAKAITDLEQQYFPNKKVFARFSDTDPQIVRDLNLEHGIPFVTTGKQNKDAQINNVRNDIRLRKIIIHPDCKNLIRQMSVGIWNNQKNKFEYVDGEGHFDMIDALVYLRRNIATTKNPYPHEYDGLPLDKFYIPKYNKDYQGLRTAILGEL